MDARSNTQRYFGVVRHIKSIEKYAGRNKKTHHCVFVTVIAPGEAYNTRVPPETAFAMLCLKDAMLVHDFVRGASKSQSTCACSNAL